MAENYPSTPTHYTLRYPPHDAMSSQTHPSAVDLYQDYLSSEYTSGIGIDIMRSLGSLDKIFDHMDGLCQNRLPGDYLESYSGTSSDVSDATQQRRHPLAYHTTPAQQAIPASHVHQDSTPPHQQPLISTQSIIADSRASPLGQVPRKATGIASPVDSGFPFMAGDGAAAFSTRFSISRPSTQSSGSDYLPSPPSHSSDKHPSHEAFYYHYNTHEALSSTAGLTSPTKQPPASSSFDFHPVSYDCMLPDSPQRYPNDLLGSNDQLFAPLRMTQDKSLPRAPWQPQRRSRRQVLPVDSATRHAPPSDLSQQGDDRPHHCGKCNRRFNRQQDLKRHNKSVHEKESIHNCKLCHRSFSRHDSLLRHQKKCGNDASISSGESIASSHRTSQRRSNRAASGSSFSAASRRRGSSSVYYK